MLHLLQVGPFVVLTSLPFRFKTLGSSHSWSCPLFCVPTFSEDPTLINTVSSSLESSSLYTLLFNLLLPLPSLTHSGFLNGMLEVSEPGALNYLTLSCRILLTLPVTSNPTLTHLPLFGSLESLQSDRTYSGFGILSMTRTLVVTSSLLSDRVNSLNFLLSLSSLDPYSDYVEVNISLNNSYSLFFLNVYAPPICHSLADAKLTPSLPPFFPPPETSSLWDSKRYF